MQIYALSIDSRPLNSRSTSGTLWFKIRDIVEKSSTRERESDNLDSLEHQLRIIFLF